MPWKIISINATKNYFNCYVVIILTQKKLERIIFFLCSTTILFLITHYCFASYTMRAWSAHSLAAKYSGLSFFSIVAFIIFLIFIHAFLSLFSYFLHLPHFLRPHILFSFSLLSSPVNFFTSEFFFRYYFFFQFIFYSISPKLRVFFKFVFTYRTHFWRFMFIYQVRPYIVPFKYFHYSLIYCCCFSFHMIIFVRIITY